MTQTQRINDAAQRLYEADSVAAPRGFAQWRDTDEVTRARYRKRAIEALRDELRADMAEVEKGLGVTLAEVLTKTVRLMVRSGHEAAAREVFVREIPVLMRTAGGPDETAIAARDAADCILRLVQAELDADETSRHLPCERVGTLVDARTLILGLLAVIPGSATAGA